MWAAEPHLEARKRVGFQVMIFLIVFAGLLYFTKKKVWRDVELHPEELKPRAADRISARDAQPLRRIAQAPAPLITSGSGRQRFRVDRDLLMRSARKRAFGERDGGVDPELGPNAVLTDAEIFVPRAGRTTRSRDASIRVASAYSTSCGSRMSMSSSTTMTRSRSLRAPNAEDRVALQAVVLRRRLAHLHHGVEAVQSAGGHFGVDDDRHRPLQDLQQARLQHVFASMMVSRP